MTRLPSDFPTTIKTTLRIGLHQGQQQLWAPYTHERKLVKLVISFDRHDSRSSMLGDFANVKLTIYPFHTPNGHVIFCRLDRESQCHVRRTRRYVRHGDSWLDDYDPGDYDPDEGAAVLHRLLGGDHYEY